MCHLLKDVLCRRHKSLEVQLARISKMHKQVYALWLRGLRDTAFTEWHYGARALSLLCRTDCSL